MCCKVNAVVELCSVVILCCRVSVVVELFIIASLNSSGIV